MRVAIITPLRQGDTSGLSLSQTYEDYSHLTVESEANASVNRNCGADMTESEFLLFLDADVTLVDDFLQVMVETLDRHPEASYTYCSYTRAGELKGVEGGGAFDADRLRASNFVSTMSLVRRSAFNAVGGFNEDLERLQDWDLWLRMLDRDLIGVEAPTTFTAEYRAGDVSTDQSNWQASVEAVGMSVAYSEPHRPCIDIVIPSWNKSDLAIECLQSIRRNTDNYHVYFIDNGSEHDELAAVQEELWNLPHTLIRLPSNLGFIKATNIGIAASTHDVVLLNNDTQVPPGWLEELWEGSDRFAIVGPLAQEGIESWQSLSNASRFVGDPLPRDGYFPVKGMVAFFCAYISRDMIEDIGYLSEFYGAGFGDDDDYCMRASAKGYEIGLSLRTVIHHEHRSTFKTLFPDYRRMQEENLRRFRGRKP